MILFIATLSPALLDLFLSSDTRICSIMAFPLLGNSDLVVVYAVVMSFFERILLISVSAAASEYCDWVQVGIDAYITNHKYQVKPDSSPWFSAARTAVIVHRNHFFCLYLK